MVRDRIYINNFCEDLNYQKVILYIGEINIPKLKKRLEKDYVNHLWYLDSIAEGRIQPFFYIENCDFQDLTMDILEFVKDGYTIMKLYENAAGYYVMDELRA